MRILIVEDEVKIRTGMAKLISAHTSHTIIGEAKNGKEGLEMAMRLHPELIISDIRMPEMDGLEMLEALEQEGISCHRVILSGYSEFEYARKAMRYGVEDYLLKPLAAEDVTDLLEKIQEKIREEEEKKALTAEGLLRELLLGGRRDKEEICRHLERQGGFQRGEPCFLVAGYTGSTKTRYESCVEERWRNLKEKNPGYNTCSTILESSQEMFCLLQGQADRKELMAKMQRRLYLDAGGEDQPVWIFTRAKALSELPELVAKCRAAYPWGMLTGYRKLLTLEEIENLEEKPYQYPKALEGEIQTAVCSGSGERLQREGENFKIYMEEMGCSPNSMRHGYIKMLNFISGICSEVNPEAYKKIRNLEVTRQAAEAVTLGELERSFDQVIQAILSFKDRKEDIRNYTIKRALGYIREHYRENLSLEILADYLEITPEYLSTLFNKEVGINFTTFLKRFRISHAKRLLKGTDKKIYEISQEVGYNDPKYFNRVFKEEIGVSPGDYRQLG